MIRLYTIELVIVLYRHADRIEYVRPGSGSLQVQASEWSLKKLV